MKNTDRKEYYSQWYAKNREKVLEYLKEYIKEYSKTPMGRAHNLLKSYNRADKKYNRGKGDLTAKWIVENIFNKPCAHCGESDWSKIGCNRIDNSKPHTKDNVEPCCYECNHKLAIEDEVLFKDRKKQVYQYSLDGELIRVWESTAETGRNGFNHSAVSRCCNGKRNKHGGYRWSYQPL